MTDDRDAAARYLENWQDEVDSASEYRSMAAAEPDPRLAKVYANLATMEEAHIAFWEQRLRDAGATVPPRRVSWRSRVLNAIARRLGPDLVLATIAAKEEVDQNVYVGQSETAGTRMPAQERWHAKVLKELVTSQPRGVQGSSASKISAMVPRQPSPRCGTKPCSRACAPARSPGCTRSQASANGPMSQAQTVPWW